MIELQGVTKAFPGARRPAVDAIDLTVPEGTICALIGPSGCGKTTTLRLVNRLVEPTSGRILVAGEDVTGADPVRLRRGIGYVIQQVGLFPHITVRDNVATVPRLLGWAGSRTAERVREMLALVGLDPEEVGHRYPHHLSGGQRQRVGVARALAGDPPVLLMDEPFGAVDPVVRGRLQEEILAILRRLGKTVVIVTHDIAEAIRMGDHVALMRDGRIAQHDRPGRLLAQPKDAFVADFVGADRSLKRLALVQAQDALVRGEPAPSGSPAVPGSASLRDVLSLLLESGAEVASVTGEGGAALGSLSLAVIRERAAAGHTS
jgi:osmoprotectant transport system ATP-binding protein